jgi:hypothetical protein
MAKRKQAATEAKSGRTKPAGDAEALIAALAPPQAALVRALRDFLTALDERVKQDVKWNSPSYRTTDHFATLHLRDPHKVLVILHLGVSGKPAAGLRERIPDPDALLEWRGADRAILTFENEAQLKARAVALRKLLRAWIAELDSASG